jgi:glucose/mannose-6-phosphate isomerase
MNNRLDDTNHIRSIDLSDLLGVAERLPEQCREGISLAAGAPLDDLAAALRAVPVTNIVTLGMGASGIGGDIIKTILESILPVPIVVTKGYNIPRFVGPGSLVLAISYSGETEETLTAFEAAIASGARAVAFTSGGTLAKQAELHNVPVVKVPAGMQPRAALGYLSLPLLVALTKLGLLADQNEGIRETLDLLDRMSLALRSETPFDSNQAKQLASRLSGRVPVIYGSEGTPGVAAFRWKCQINENSKSPAFWNQFPDLDHNEITGWQELKNVTEHFCLIQLRMPGEPARINKRVEVTMQLIKDSFGEIVEVTAEGKSSLARLFSLMYLGDVTSMYLAILNGVDPTPVERIQELKRRLKDN